VTVTSESNEHAMILSEDRAERKTKWREQLLQNGRLFYLNEEIHIQCK
jgi:hypothetical protein